MRISDWSSDVCSSDLGQIDAALHVIDPGPVEAVAVAAHRERVRKRAHRVDGVDMGDDEDAGTAIVRAGVKHSAIAETVAAREALDRHRFTGDFFENQDRKSTRLNSSH